ncbi:hypothetical protein GCM10010280_22770 [Streptomyces pilosus]|uniref:Integrase catalytic domain-containing protein n=1 Tax=Streptomyces pilosus TaxID=28893 RepID=A0A918BKN1_9ACTN|nr:hypothetical protein GCM10010280_22770 [Streptomyces pilosus]
MCRGRHLRRLPDPSRGLVRARGITVECVLTDNAWAYTKNTWRRTCHDLDISPRWTRPWRPQTNGRVERFHRTLLEEWAYARPYHSEQERRDAFPSPACPPCDPSVSPPPRRSPRAEAA